MPYPTSYDFWANPAAGDSLSAASVQHNLEHQSANNLISSLQMTVGLTNATATTTHDYKISALSAWATALAVSASGLSASAGGLSASAQNNYVSASALSASAQGIKNSANYYWAIATVTANTTATTANVLIRTSGTLTATMPGAIGSGRYYVFKDISGTAIISGSGSDKIDGVATAQLTAQYQTLTLVDAASGNWNIV